jgi:hypothetical protein
MQLFSIGKGNRFFSIRLFGGSINRSSKLISSHNLLFPHQTKKEWVMSTLSKLKFIAAKKVVNQNPVAVRRTKLASKLHEQTELASAKKEGRAYAPTRIKTVVDDDTGERKTILAPKRVKEWFWVADNGKINLAVRYGSKVIEINKGKNAIECGNADELLQALTLLKTAVLAGELDEQIASAADSLRSGFER